MVRHYWVMVSYPLQIVALGEFGVLSKPVGLKKNCSGTIILKLFLSLHHIVVVHTFMAFIISSNAVVFKFFWSTKSGALYCGNKISMNSISQTNVYKYYYCCQLLAFSYRMKSSHIGLLSMILFFFPYLLVDSSSRKIVTNLWSRGKRKGGKSPHTFGRDSSGKKRLFNR